MSGVKDYTVNKQKNNMENQSVTIVTIHWGNYWVNKAASITSNITRRLNTDPSATQTRGRQHRWTRQDIGQRPALGIQTRGDNWQ